VRAFSFSRDLRLKSCVTKQMNKELRRVAPPAAWLMIVLLASTIACAADPERVALEAAVQRWATAVNAQDVNALSATMTEDVELLDGSKTVTGREAAIRALREVATRGKLVATHREMTISGDAAWRVAALVQTQKNGDVHARGATLEIWRRVNGKSRLHRMMSAGLLAPADLLTRPSPTEPVLDRPVN